MGGGDGFDLPQMVDNSPPMTLDAMKKLAKGAVFSLCLALGFWELFRYGYERPNGILILTKILAASCNRETFEPY